jgi:hypothetical protein
MEYIGEIESVIEEYESARSSFEKMQDPQSSVRLPHIALDSSWTNELLALKGYLRKVIIGCETAIGSLEPRISPIPESDLNKLASLRKELKDISGRLSDPNYETNCTMALEEYEKGHFLASALISGRVIIYALAQLPGGSTEEKIKLLTEEGRIEKTKDNVYESFILKADKKARNFSSHNIKVFPTASDAISLIGDAVGILKFLTE